MNYYAKVEGHLNLLRDLKTNAIINTDKISSDHYSIAKRKKEEEKLRVDKIETELLELKSSIEEVKQLLKDIANES